MGRPRYRTNVADVFRSSLDDSGTMTPHGPVNVVQAVSTSMGTGTFSNFGGGILLISKTIFLNVFEKLEIRFEEEIFRLHCHS